MGIYMTHYAFIGVKFSPSTQLVDRIQRGCSHDGAKAKFCSECGAPMWKDKQDRVNQFDDIHEELIEPLYEELEEHFNEHVVVGTDHDGDAIYIGYGTSVENFEESNIPLIDQEIVKSVLQPILEKYKIWNQCSDTLGFWLVSTGH